MRLHETTLGQGPDLLLLHGWAMHSGIFAPLLPHLTPYFRVRCIDLPGHGQSRDSAVALQLDGVWQQIAETLHTPTLLMGWSLGGLFALHGALQGHAMLRGVILQNASPSFVAAPGWPQGMPAAVFQNFAAELALDYRETLHRFFMLEAQGSEHVRADLRLLQKTAFEFGEPKPQALYDGLQLLESTDLRTQLPALPCRSLWLAGRRDRLVNPLAMQEAARLANGAYHCDAHGGHAPFLTHPQDVARRIRDFHETLA